MKSEFVHVIKLLCAACVISLLCTAAVYRFFPQYLCYIVYDVHESDFGEREDKQIKANAQYVEKFIPTCNYIKDIAFNLKAREGSNTSEYITGSLVDDGGKVLAESRYELKESEIDVYCEFAIEKWVDVGREYQFVINFPDSEDVYVTFGTNDMSLEHVQLLCDNEEVEQSMYLRYTYGCYSKKLLAMWFLTFVICAYLLGELLTRRGKE